MGELGGKTNIYEKSADFGSRGHVLCCQLKGNFHCFQVLTLDSVVLYCFVNSKGASVASRS